MRCCCDEVTGGRWITLLLMIIKRTICAKPLGCLSLLSHMEWMFYLLLLWISLNVFGRNEALQLKCIVNIVLCLHASPPYWQKAALIKGIQWCTIWVTKYATEHNIRHVSATRCCIRKYVPCGVIWSAQPMPGRLEMQTKDLRLMQVDWSFIDSFWWSTVPAMFEQWGWICPVIHFMDHNFSLSHLYMTWVQCHLLKCPYESNGNFYWQLWKAFVQKKEQKRIHVAPPGDTR